MAAADADDLLTCSVCFNEFDDKSHKPKFLSCHHTLCLECIKSMKDRMLLTCPLCRKDTFVLGTGSELANNIYILHMIASRDLPSTQISRKEYWCFKCKKEATKFCVNLSNHPTISMGSKSSDFCHDLQEIKDTMKNQMALLINKRKEAKKYLNQLSNSVDHVEDTIQKLEEENDLHLAEMVSLLESSETDIPKDESASSLFKKLQDSVQLMKDELKDVEDMEERYLDHLKNTTITVHFKHKEKGDLPPVTIPPLLDHQDDENKKSLILASHILLSNLKISSRNIPRSPASSSSSEPAGIDFYNSVFSMTFSQWDRTIGTIELRPNPHFYRDFGHAFGRFCWSSPKQFDAQIEKAHPASFAVIGFSNPHFQPTIPDPDEFMEIHRQYSLLKAEGSMDVGFFDFDYGENGTLLGFTLSFHLRDQDVHHMRRKSPLFGRMTEGEAVLDALSRKKLNERDGFSVSIHCRRV